MLSGEDRKYVLLGMFVTSIVTANLLGSKFTEFLGLKVSVGILAYAVTFPITDIVTEVYGKEEGKRFVTAGLVSSLFTFILLAAFLSLPWSPVSRVDQETYYRVFSASLRIVAASLLAYAVSQYHDVWAFHLWKKATRGRHLWLRNNASTMVSQFIDTMVFNFAGLLYLTPRLTLPVVLQIALLSYAAKLILAALDTPFVYLGVAWLTQGLKAEPS